MLSKRFFFPLIIIIVAIVGFVFFREFLSFETLNQNHAAILDFKNNNYWISALIFFISYIVLVTFALPGSPIASLTGGFLFGLGFGAFLNVTAATCGATLIFLTTKHGFGKTLTQKIDTSDGTIRKFRDGIRKNEISYLLLIRLIPIIPFAVANIAPALFDVSLKRFFVTTYLGIIPGGFVFTWLGVGLSEVFANNQKPNFNIIFEPYIIGPLVGLCVLSLIPIILKRSGLIQD